MAGLINGDFGIWQRGSTLPAGTGFRFGPDMWAVHSAGSTVAVQRERFSPSQTEVPGNPKYYAQITVQSVAGVGHCTRFGQPIEDVRRYAGETITWSFYAKSDTSKNIAIELGQFFGSGSPTTASQSSGVQKIALTTQWQRFDIVIDVASVVGKEIGPSGDDCLQAVFWLDADSAYDSRTDRLGQQSGRFEFAQCGLAEGDQSGDMGYLKPRPIYEQLAECERYCEKSYNLDVAPGELDNRGVVTHVKNPNDSYLIWIPFRQRMRTPEVTCFSFNTGARHKVVQEYTDVCVHYSTTLGECGFFVHLDQQFAKPERYFIQWLASVEDLKI